MVVFVHFYRAMTVEGGGRSETAGWGGTQIVQGVSLTVILFNHELERAH